MTSLVAGRIARRSRTRQPFACLERDLDDLDQVVHRLLTGVAGVRLLQIGAKTDPYQLDWLAEMVSMDATSSSNTIILGVD